MRRLLGVVVIALVLALVLAGCGHAGAPDRPPDEADAPSPGVVDGPTPPPIRLLVDGAEVEAGPVSYCWTQPSGAGTCVDLVGTPLHDLPVVEGRTVEFRFAVPRARFTAWLGPVGRGAANGQVDATDAGGGTYRLDGNTRAPGRYRVTLSARLPQGEAPGEFVWVIPEP